MNETKHWYLSKAILAGIVTILTMVAMVFGYEIKIEEQNAIVTNLTAVIGLVAAMVALIGRIVANKKIGK